MNPEEHKVVEGSPRREHHRMLFFIYSISFFGGIAGGAFAGDWYMGMLGWVLFPIVLSFLTRKSFWITVIFSVIFFGIGAYLSISSYTSRIHHIQTLKSTTQHLSGKYTLTGRLVQRLYQTDLRQTHLMKIDTISTRSGEVVDIGEGKIQLLLDTPKNLQLGVDDVISFGAKIQPLYSGALDGFERYTFFHDIAGKVSPSTFQVKARGERYILAHIADRTESQIFRGFPREVASILLGITVGNTELMSRNLQSNFRNAGITHILVVSGSNITFLLMFLSGILRYFPVRRGIHVSILILGILTYSTLVGWGPPVIRASIMGSIAYITLLSGQKVSSLAILLMIGVLFLCFSPLSLLYDPSFGLSFGATLSIILFGKPLSNTLKKWGIHDIVSDTIAITLAASIGTLPVTVYHFGQISIGFFVANIAIGLIMGALLFLTTWYLLLGFLGQTFLYWFGYILYIPALWIIFIAQYVGKWGMLSIVPPWDTLILIFGVLIWIIAIFLTLTPLSSKDQITTDRQ